MTSFFPTGFWVGSPRLYPAASVEVEVTTSRAAVAQGGGCSAVVSVQRACNPTEMAAAGHAPRAPTRAQPDAERSGLDKPGLVWTRG